MLARRDPAPGDGASHTYPSATMHGQGGGGDRDFLLSQQLRCQGAVVAPGSQPSQLSGLPKLPTPAQKEPSNPLDIFSPQHPWRCQLLLAVCRHPVAIITSSSLPEKKQTALQGRKSPKSLSSGRNVCSQKVSRPGTCSGLNKILWDLAIAKCGARLAGTSGAWRQLGCGLWWDVQGWLSREVQGFRH